MCTIIKTGSFALVMQLVMGEKWGKTQWTTSLLAASFSRLRSWQAAQASRLPRWCSPETAPTPVGLFAIWPKVAGGARGGSPCPGVLHLHSCISLLMLSIPGHLDRACRIWRPPARQLSDPGLRCFLRQPTQVQELRTVSGTWTTNYRSLSSAKRKYRVPCSNVINNFKQATAEYSTRLGPF